MNPNSANQLWSKWTFVVHEGGRRVPAKDVEYNAARWLRAGFGSVGRARVVATSDGWLIECLVEGRPAHDLDYVASVRSQFNQRFVSRWGPMAWSEVSVRIMAGDKQDGTPRAQMVVLPSIRVEG